jgi:glutathione S-transferase
MAVMLHRCPITWLRIDPHPCWRVQKALDEAGVDYVVVTGPLARGRRDALERLSGQRRYPVLELEDGSVHRAESKEMAERIRAGWLFEGHLGAAQGGGEEAAEAAPTA